MGSGDQEHGLEEVERGCPCLMRHWGSRSSVSLAGDYCSPLVEANGLDLAHWGSLEAPALGLSHQGAGCLPDALSGCLSASYLWWHRGLKQRGLGCDEE